MPMFTTFTHGELEWCTKGVRVLTRVMYQAYDNYRQNNSCKDSGIKRLFLWGKGFLKEIHKRLWIMNRIEDKCEANRALLVAKKGILFPAGRRENKLSPETLAKNSRTWDIDFKPKQVCWARVKPLTDKCWTLSMIWETLNPLGVQKRPTFSC